MDYLRRNWPHLSKNVKTVGNNRIITYIRHRKNRKQGLSKNGTKNS